jgi:hypothetical protein
MSLLLGTQCAEVDPTQEVEAMTLDRWGHRSHRRLKASTHQPWNKYRHEILKEAQNMNNRIPVLGRKVRGLQLMLQELRKVSPCGGPLSNEFMESKMSMKIVSNK